MSSSTDQKTTEIEKASAEPSVDTSDATVADNTADAETAAAPTPAGDSNETTAKPAEDKEAAPVKPASKLSATAKDFTFNAKVAEFKPKWMDGGAAAAAPAGPMGQPPKGGAAYNAGANEFVPNFGGPHPGMQQVIQQPGGLPMMWNAQMGQYVPMQMYPPNMMGHQGGMYPPQHGYNGGNMGGHGGGYHNKGARQGGNYNASGGNRDKNGSADKNAASPRLPEAGAIRFSEFTPKQDESKAADEKPKDENTAEASIAPADEDKEAGTKKEELKIDTAPKANRWSSIHSNRDAAAAAAASPATDSKDSTSAGAWGKEKLSSATASGNASPSGWKRGEAMGVDLLANKDDGHMRYDKAALLSFFTKGKIVPPEIKALYPDHSQQERAPMVNKGGRTPQGDHKGKKGKQEDLEPHPDTAEIFDFSKKENVFSLQKDRLADDTDPDVIVSKANLILNKLSVTKFDKLSDEFMSCGLADSDDLLRRAVDMIVSKAQMEEHFCFMYADLCKKITELWAEGGKIRNPEDSSQIPTEEEPNSLGKLFRQKLLQRCQEEFNVDRVQALADIREDEKLSPEDKEEKEMFLKKCYTGHMRFIGELYLKDLVTAKIMHNCLNELLSAEAEEGTLVCMCKLLVTIGHKLEGYDNRKGLDNFNGYFSRIEEVMKSHPNSRMRFMLRDLIEQRRDGWTARREEERAMDMAELRGGKANKAQSPRGHAPDEWTTVLPSKKGSSGKGGSQKSGSNDVRSTSGKSSPASQSGNAFSALSSSGNRSPGKSPLKQSWTATTSSPNKKDDGGSNSGANSPKGKNPEQAVNKDKAAATDVPGADGKINKEVRDKVRGILGEYYMNDDAPDALTTFKEVIHPNAMGEVIGQPKGCIDFVFEKHPGNGKNLCKLLEYLFQEKFLTKEQVKKALFLFLDNFDETCIDSPKASEYGGEIIACLIADGLLSLTALSEVPEDSMWHMSYRRAGFMGDLLTALVDRTSADSVESELTTLAAKLDVLSMVPTEPKQSDEDARTEYLNKYQKLAFLSK